MTIDLSGDGHDPELEIKQEAARILVDEVRRDLARQAEPSYWHHGEAYRAQAAQRGLEVVDALDENLDAGELIRASAGVGGIEGNGLRLAALILTGEASPDHPAVELRRQRQLSRWAELKQADQGPVELP